MAKSYSQISLYEKCAFAYHCKYIQKLDEPKSEALKRGIAVHNKIEEFLKGKRKTLNDMHPASSRFIKELKKLNADAEEFWHFNKQWELVEDWDWLVVKMDACCVPSDTVLRVVDFKTGKPYPTHKEQLHLYATAGFSTYDCEMVEAIAAYVDTGASVVYRWQEQEYEKMKSSWNKRIENLELEKDWKMKEGFHCKWCAFGKSKGGPCSYG